jgi:hypothetical protein
MTLSFPPESALFGQEVDLLLPRQILYSFAKDHCMGILREGLVWPFFATAQT